MAEVVLGVLSASNLRPSMNGIEHLLGDDVMRRAWHVEPGVRPTFERIVNDLDLILRSNDEALNQPISMV
jgi:hypothetical protein